MSLYKAKTVEYLNEFPNLASYNDVLQDYIATSCKAASKMYNNAGYSGAHHDGGAGKLMHGLKEFVRGYELGLKDREEQFYR